jgi:hypothetical protein
MGVLRATDPLGSKVLQGLLFRCVDLFGEVFPAINAWDFSSPNCRQIRQLTLLLNDFVVLKQQPRDRERGDGQNCRKLTETETQTQTVTPVHRLTEHRRLPSQVVLQFLPMHISLEIFVKSPNSPIVRAHQRNKRSFQTILCKWNRRRMRLRQFA